MKTLAAWLSMTAALAAPALAGDYAYANRPQVTFPGPRGGIVHVSPFPMSSRAAAVWASDSCWRDCTSAAGWRFGRCLGVENARSCRTALDAADRACQRTCRTRGAPYLNITDY